MKMLFLNPADKDVQTLEVPHEIDEWYKILGCELVEMPVRYINGRPFTIICDEEGAYRKDCRISAIDSCGKVMLVGPLLICKEDKQSDCGQITELTDSDIAFIKRHVRRVPTRSYPDGCLMLTDVWYSAFPPGSRMTVNTLYFY